MRSDVGSVAGQTGDAFRSLAKDHVLIPGDVKGGGVEELSGKRLKSKREPQYSVPEQLRFAPTETEEDPEALGFRKELRRSIGRFAPDTPLCAPKPTGSTPKTKWAM